MTSLTEEQWGFLRGYRLYHDLSGEAKGVTPRSLMSEEGMISYLSDRMPLIGTDDLKVAASLFLKRYAFTVALGLMAMTYWNKRINLSPDHLLLTDGEKNGKWMPFFHLKNSTVTECVSHQDKVDYIQSIFQGHLTPLVQVLKKATGMSDAILWENIAVYVFWIYENDDFLGDDRTRKERDEQFSELLSHQNSTWFGRFKKNPLARYHTSKAKEEVRVRKTCCLSYMVEDGEQYRCKTCPQTLCRK
ncbi:siderophore-iron reductase FhuF [Bacillus sp. KH172YL63]|uniref:siderophore-iron reductase FhuF n=1 Tax=Bacillus sp. KH172YL63 TaxID=2709784 RepID=UPI0013E50FA4|nr:siderophore-iron reductase FhuF [Bacillus sp. KH172YL63]BCB05524.1 hypothetical protein KH172YL63_36570 [Bacillus sp. KH172YL63]